MKYSQRIGIIATVILVISNFLPWTYYPDLDKNFTGFLSEQNVYGKPGYVFIVFGIFAIAFFAIPKIWAKRWNFFMTALILAYAIKSFILFSGCYSGICPTTKAGIWLMLISAVVIIIMAVIPDMKTLPEKPE
jgi:hypothetical protein